MDKKEKKVGRKAKYDPEVTPKLAESYAMDGFSDKQIAEKLGIAECTIYDWANRHPEFSEALKRGKEPVNAELKIAMMKTAMGYYVDEEETVTILDVNTRTPTSYKKTTRKKYIPPNGTLQIFLSKNRMPEQFRDVNKHEISGLNGQPIKIDNGYDLSKLSKEKLLQLREILVEANAEYTSDNTGN